MFHLISRPAAAVFLVFLLGFVHDSLSAQTRTIAVDDDNGYAGRVVEKVMEKWSPPSVRGTHTVLVKLLLDGEGAVSSCTALKRSSLDAFDNVACSAIRKAAPFGRTSYEAPLTLYLSFRIGNEDSKEAPSEIEKLRAELKEKNRQENERASREADAALQRSRERAQAAANERGEPLPKIHPQPVVREAPAKERGRQEPAKAAQPETQKQTRKDPVLHSYGERPNARDDEKLPVVSSKAEIRAQKYTDLLHSQLTRVLRLPSNAKHTSYSLRMGMTVDDRGRLSKVNIEQSSGDPSVDEALVRCVRQAKTVPAPPKGIGNTFSVPLTATKK